MVLLGFWGRGHRSLPDSPPNSRGPTLGAAAPSLLWIPSATERLLAGTPGWGAQQVQVRPGAGPCSSCQRLSHSPAPAQCQPRPPAAGWGAAGLGLCLGALWDSCARRPGCQSPPVPPISSSPAGSLLCPAAWPVLVGVCGSDVPSLSTERHDRTDVPLRARATTSLRGLREGIFESMASVPAAEHPEGFAPHGGWPGHVLFPGLSLLLCQEEAEPGLRDFVS